MREFNNYECRDLIVLDTTINSHIEIIEIIKIIQIAKKSRSRIHIQSLSFKKYPNRSEMIIKDLFDNLESLDEPEAKASMIWIIGEFAERIEDAMI